MPEPTLRCKAAVPSGALPAHAGFATGQQHLQGADSASHAGRQQQTTQHWADGAISTAAAAAVSPECRDLLDRIFSVDPTQRLSMHDILHHPWCRQPLPPKYNAALDAMASRQAQLKQSIGLHTADNVIAPTPPPPPPLPCLHMHAPRPLSSPTKDDPVPSPISRTCAAFCPVAVCLRHSIQI